MRKYLFLSMNCIFLFSCSIEDEKEKLSNSDRSSSVYSGKVAFVYDNMYEVKGGKVYELFDNEISYNTLNSQVGRGVNYKFEVFSTNMMGDGFIYLGSAFSRTFFNQQGSLKPLGNIDEKNMIKAKTSASSESYMINASLLASRQLNENVKEEQLLSSKSYYRYSVKKINKFNDLSLLFGYNRNLGSFFGPITLNNTTTTIVLDLVQEYYSTNLIADINWNIYKSPEILQKYFDENPLYINSIDYGRRTLLLLQSQKFSYEELLFALREMNEVSDSSSYSQLTKDVINDKEMYFSVNNSGGSSGSQVILSGVENFINDFKRPGLGKGRPIFFKANYAQTNKPFVSVIGI